MAMTVDEAQAKAAELRAERETISQQINTLQAKAKALSDEILSVELGVSQATKGRTLPVEPAVVVLTPKG